MDVFEFILEFFEFLKSLLKILRIFEILKKKLSQKIKFFETFKDFLNFLNFFQNIPMNNLILRFLEHKFIKKKPKKEFFDYNPIIQSIDVRKRARNFIGNAKPCMSSFLKSF